MMIRSIPPASAHLALRPVPAPPPMIGRPSATLRRNRSRISARVLPCIERVTPGREGRSLRALTFGLGEPVADHEPEPGQDVAAVERVVLAQEDRAVGGGGDPHGPGPGIGVPDQADARPDVFAELAVHLPG